MAPAEAEANERDCAHQDCRDRGDENTARVRKHGVEIRCSICDRVHASDLLTSKSTDSSGRFHIRVSTFHVVDITGKFADFEISKF